MRPIIAFITDFGTRDHYVGAMKGAALSVCPDATLVDITHDIAPQDVLGGALELEAAYRFFPPGTIFVAVVDPGVGSARRGIAAQAGEYRFVAPDNGLLTLVLRESARASVVELTDRQYARPIISRTFEGRDRFAPAAGWLATGLELSRLGPAVSDWMQLFVPRAQRSSDALRGEVLRVDRFGNLVTNVGRDAVAEFSQGGSVRVAAAGRDVGTPVDTYAAVGHGTLCALFGSSGYLEIAENGGSAAARLGLARGAAVIVTRG